MRLQCPNCNRILEKRGNAKYCTPVCRRAYLREHPEAREVKGKRIERRFVNNSNYFTWKEYPLGIL